MIALPWQVPRRSRRRRVLRAELVHDVLVLGHWRTLRQTRHRDRIAIFGSSVTHLQNRIQSKQVLDPAILMVIEVELGDARVLKLALELLDRLLVEGVHGNLRARYDLLSYVTHLHRLVHVQ